MNANRAARSTSVPSTPPLDTPVASSRRRAKHSKTEKQDVTNSTTPFSECMSFTLEVPLLSSHRSAAARSNPSATSIPPASRNWFRKWKDCAPGDSETSTIHVKTFAARVGPSQSPRYANTETNCSPETSNALIGITSKSRSWDLTVSQSSPRGTRTPNDISTLWGLRGAFSTPQRSVRGTVLVFWSVFAGKISPLVPHPSFSSHA